MESEEQSQQRSQKDLKDNDYRPRKLYFALMTPSVVSISTFQLNHISEQLCMICTVLPFRQSYV